MTENLTKQTFLEKVFNYEKNKDWMYEGKLPAIIDFYADWCGYCKQFKPEVQKYKGLPVEYVDCTQPSEKERSAMSQYGVSGFPAMFYKSDTKTVTFNKARTTQGIEEFVNECRM